MIKWLIIFLLLPARVVAADWFWLDSNAKYSKYFDADSVAIKKYVVTEGGQQVPIELEAWTKTTYSADGAKETLLNYKLQEVLRAEALEYSLALLRVNPQNRTLQYVREEFYNGRDELIWSKEAGSVREVTARSFDEEFYCAIVDEVFAAGERDRKKSGQRWLELWVERGSKTRQVSADTASARLKGSNLIIWTWQEQKEQERTVEIRFVKVAINLVQGTLAIKEGQIWQPQTGWRPLEFEGSYREIVTNEPEYQGLVRLRAYAKANLDWLKRYSLEE